MNISICFEYDPRGWNRDLWLYLITGFGVQGYERVPPDDETYGSGNNYDIIRIAGIEDLPDKPLVFIQPIKGRFINGELNLINYSHPKDAIYYFGSDRAQVDESNFGDRKYDSVYIPQKDETVQHELFSHQAGAILIYDVKAKGG